MVIGAYSDLAGKTVLVTGASSGIGAAIAAALSDQGAEVIASGRNKQKLEAVAAEIKVAKQIQADLVNAEQRDELIDILPELDGICHCAGVISPFPVSFVDESRTRAVMEVNFHIPALLTSSLLQKKKLRAGAALVYISSISSFFPHNGGAMYSASKAAMEAYCRNVAIEHSKRKIRANFIRAGMVKTAIYAEAEKFDPKSMQAHIKRYPLGPGEAEDVASAALFLLSDASRWITGSGITLDGGLSLGQA